MERIKKIIENVKRTIRNICDSIKNAKSEIDFYKDMWDDPRGKHAVSQVWKWLKILLKKIKPKQIEGNVIFGTKDPALTGQLIGGIAAVYGFIPEKLRIIPDFEEERYEGTLRIRGKIRLIHVLAALIGLIADKNVRYVYRKIQAKEDMDNE